MSYRRTISLALATCLAAAAGDQLNRVWAGSIAFEITADTSGLAQGAGGLIDVSLSAAFPPGPPASVLLQVGNPITDGTILAGGVLGTPLGTASGDLTTPGGVSADNTQFSELTQNFSVSSFFDVFVTLSGPEIGPGASGPWSGTAFYFTIYDSGVGSENATFLVNPDVDSNGNPIVDGAVTYFTSGSPIQVIPLNSSVPEPSGLLLLGLGIGIVALAGRLRGRHTT